MTNTLTKCGLQQMGQVLGLRLADSALSVAGGDNLFPHTDLALRLGERFSRSDRLPWLSVGSLSGSESPPDMPDNEEGLFVFWFPYGLPKRYADSRSIFVASSRMQKDKDHSDWFDALRTLVCRLDESCVHLLTSNGTAADRFVRRAAELFGIQLVSVCRGPQKVDTSWFLKSVDSDGALAGNSDCLQGFVFHLGAKANEKSDSKKALDAILVRIADEVRVLSVRKNGNVDKAITERCKRFENPNVFLLDSKSETQPVVLERLYESGCHRWMLFDHNQEADGDGVENDLPQPEFRVPTVSELPDGEFLIHCTRARQKAWPDQAEAEYLDDLIFQHKRKDHSLYATLTRILATGRILANNQLTRHHRKVVCFTSATLEEIKSLTTFRPHLNRWDFQPVGIAIRLSALKKRGARPVIYGDQSTWEELDAEDRPFFQVANTTTKTGNVLDWTREKEWRVLGDVELREFEEGEIFAISAM